MGLSPLGAGRHFFVDSAGEEVEEEPSSSPSPTS